MKNGIVKAGIYVNLNLEQKEQLDELVTYNLQGISGVIRSALDLYYSTINDEPLHEDVQQMIKAYKSILK